MNGIVTYLPMVWQRERN